MRTYLLFLLCVVPGALLAQTVYSGESTIDKTKAQGLFLTVPGDGRQIEKDWENQLKSYGRLTSSRGTYRVTNADIKDVSSEPVNLMSTVKTSRNQATIFVAYDLGGGNFVTTGTPGYSAAETMLKNFAGQSQYNQEVRTAEGGLNDAQQSHQKLVRAGERLQREIEQNGKEKERLLKRLDENAKQLEQLTKDIETNKTEQATALTNVDNQKTAVEAVKAKKP